MPQDVEAWTCLITEGAHHQSRQWFSHLCNVRSSVGLGPGKEAKHGAAQSGLCRLLIEPRSVEAGARQTLRIRCPGEETVRSDAVKR